MHWAQLLATAGLALSSLTAPSATAQQTDPYAEVVPAFNRGDFETVFALAAGTGDPDAQFMLGLMYSSGRGVLQDASEAARWYRRSAEQGNVDAQLSLGRIYDGGVGVPKNHFEAVRWYRLAAEQGNGDAQWRLGAAYQFGTGVPRNLSEAFRWTAIAAEKGFAEAQSNLGVMYSNGHGVPEDDAAAAHWFRLAAERGSYTGQRNLARAYELGEGVPRDLVLAYMWLNLAAAQEPPLAAGVDALGARAALDEVGRLLTPAALIEAQRLSREWKPAASSGGMPTPGVPSGPGSAEQIASAGSVSRDDLDESTHCLA